MVSGVIECGYCKEKVSRNGYGKHLLSKHHQEQFLKENKEEIDECLFKLPSKTPKTTINNPAYFKVNSEQCRLCFSCKRFYLDKDSDTTLGRMDAQEHFEKSPNCKTNYLASLKKFTVVKKKPVDNKALEALQKEVAYWKKEAKYLKDALDTNEEDYDRLAKRSQMLEKIIGNATTDDELDIRLEYIKKKFKLPLYE